MTTPEDLAQPPPSPGWGSSPPGRLRGPPSGALARTGRPEPPGDRANDGAPGERLRRLRGDLERLRAAADAASEPDEDTTGELPLMDLPLPTVSTELVTAAPVPVAFAPASVAVEPGAVRPPAALLPPQVPRRRGRVPSLPRRPLVRRRPRRPPRFARPLPAVPLPRPLRFLPRPRWATWNVEAVLVATVLAVVAVAQLLYRLWIATSTTSPLLGTDPVPGDFVTAAGGVVGGALTAAVAVVAIGVARGQLRYWLLAAGLLVGFGVIPYEIYAAGGRLANPPLPALAELIVPPGWDRGVQLRAAFLLMVVALVATVADLVVRWMLHLSRMGREPAVRPGAAWPRGGA